MGDICQVGWGHFRAGGIADQKVRSTLDFIGQNQYLAYPIQITPKNYFKVYWVAD